MNTRTLFLWVAASCVATASVAATPIIRIERMPLGSGLQNASGTENAEPVGDYGVWHVPQYMPGYPTSATIWPRVVIIQCNVARCSGYEVTPELGRGEYLFFRPAENSSVGGK
ncbi:hypothetical protein [Acidovorax cavernicola]|uniref:Flagellar protein FlhE n=1 Tax=Acidovorax cavernicola TaxID=1675792 RepID=A0A9X8GY59_9BURK|nr:hypothetical protein [Acidovorax cavernicola]RIX85346.1 hypothetical protein D3H34_02110 [Acidovorax cavernicola]